MAKAVALNFGRMNPPTIGHEKLANAVKKTAKQYNAEPRLYLSHSQDSKKNPLSYEQKIKHVRKMFPKHARNIISNKSYKTVFEVVTGLYDQGFNKITMVVGSDRVTEF